MRDHICYFEAIDMLLHPPFSIWAPKKTFFRAPIDGDFFLVLVHTFVYILTKFQVNTILFRVKPPERLD